ncbi:DNA replication checkpoint mediator, MRC1 domain protein [Kalmanozyma brasiliensis GHG001]|uniref:DNA replication checkpoint mediator MRC1 domain-containing protein n=1 Tax=Kalmanozyma brasiliensis (strain GHG001) TaxID=1365824 RepID=V5GM68_KALBG|nr:DNA replication checkpoint mediator, MRC1 domain protein [Kalmanozyma brasiliensis GHG001]EST07047.1 DNA replication checkpoint mediator, MRC1 domain protein [Kalmanozyma brasiliensis GHG001]
MQVDTAAVATSSPLSSLVSSSVPSIEPAPPVAGARAKVTYSRKPLAPENEASSSSSQPTSPSDNLFDSPMRSYGRKAASHLDHDANDVTITNEVSPATTAPAGNSAIKIGASSLFRRVDSHNSQHSQDNDQQQSSTESPAVNRTKKFQFGAARAIFDSDSDSDGDLGSKLTSRPLAGNADQTDDEVIARIRAQQARYADSDPFTGSLSSVPPSSSQAHSTMQRPMHDSGDEHMADDDQDNSANISRPRGGKISAMRGKGGKPSRSKFSESSDKEASAGSDVDDDEVNARKPRTFKLVSSASSASATPANQDASVDDEPALTRRDKVAALAARARKAHGAGEGEMDANTEADPLLDAFFGGGSPGRIPSRSPSLDIQGSDEDEHNDAMPAFMALNSKSAAAKSKSKKSKKAAPVERDILDDPQDDPKHASKRAAASKEKGPPKIKPLSKKEVDAMHKQTARLARENRTRLAPAHQKKTIGLNDLLIKISAGEAFRGHASQAASTSNSADAASDSSAQPSSQIPSGQSKSQHASDPIESDPIPERSSPHPAYSSSPVLPVSRQQDRRLGLDQSSSNANILQNSAAGRVGGLATKQGPNAQMLRQQHLLAGADDDEDAQLPDLASIVKQSRDQQEADKDAARKKQHLLEMKLRLLEKSRQQAFASNEAATKPVNADAADGDDLELYTPGSVLAAKHNILTTPGKPRPTDQLYREIGIRPGKTSPSRKSYTGTNANGSPNADHHSADHVEMADGHDELLVTDSQLRTAGKGLFVASDKAAGHVPATQPPPVSTQPSVQASSRQAAPRSGPLKLTQAQLNANLMRQMQSQSLKARSQKDAKDASAKAAAGSVVDKYGRSAAPDVQAMLQRLGETANDQAIDQTDRVDEDEDDPDYIMPPARNAESAVGSDVDMGSASEIDENDDFIDMGSADEGDENMDVQEAGTRDTIEEADEEHDSEKENAPPPASQQSQRSNASPSLSRSLLPSRAVMDDDEDELPAARPHARRGRRSALADDDDDADDEAALQPGPFDRNRGNVHADEASQSQGHFRVPLGDISSQSIDQSMPFSRSNTTSPAMQHAPAPRRDPLVVPLSAGHDEDESFRTDDIPSQAASLGRFFEPTMPPPPTAKSALAASSAHKSFWDQTQTQDETQDPSQLPSSVHPGPRDLTRDESANSALGAFFQDTQQDSLRGESLDIFDNPKTAHGKAPGFTQFFFDGTPPPSASAKWDASTMPPPKSTEVDAFAALRKAQMSDAMGLLEPTPSVLPSFDESQAEREAYASAQANASPEKMYMNRDGFFTQTKPSTQAGLWSQYDDSQSQSQSQLRGGVTQSPALRRGSEISNIGDQGVSIFDDEEDAPVQLKRLRRGARFADEEVVHQPEASDAGSDMDDDAGPPSSQPEPKTRNAFDVLREGPLPDPEVRSKKRKSAFIEGEAEESEDEELNPKRGDAGGLKGVFGDDADSSGAEEESEDDADAADLTELVDNERDLDEATKDEIARARFREDMDARDREDLEIHQKAIQGGYRNRRRGVGLNGIEGFLDDDADDEELKRRATMGGGASWKKRKLLDGTEDGMDKLAAHEEALPFVQGYAATHRVDHESDKYDFLTMEVAADDGEESDEEEEEEDVVEEDAFGPVVGQPKTMNRSTLASIVRERRKAGKRALSDDEEERRDNDWDSDEDRDEALTAAMRDRTKASAPSQPVPSKRVQQGAQYGRNSRPAPAPQVTDEPMEDDPDDEGTSLMARMLARPTASKTVETLDDVEPEWGNDAGIVRAPKPAASGTSQSSSLGKSISTGMKTGGEKRRMGSMLLSKQIMRRESGFSSSSGSKR